MVDGQSAGHLLIEGARKICSKISVPRTNKIQSKMMILNKNLGTTTNFG